MNSKTSRDQNSDGAEDWQPTLRDGILWGLLVLVVLVLVGATLWRSMDRIAVEPLPILGEVPEFDLTNRDGRTIQRSNLIGRPWVADFIFTRCAAICPRMTEQMKRVQELLADHPVAFASFSVHPVHDTPEVLEEYAQRYGAADSWLFLTGGREEIHTLCRDGFKLAVGDAVEPDAIDPIFHSNRFVLIDSRGMIRGYYDAFDAADIERLVQDAERLL